MSEQPEGPDLEAAHREYITSRRADQAAEDTRDMMTVFIESLEGADRVVIETKNALGEMDARYMHAPAILESWNARKRTAQIGVEMFDKTKGAGKWCKCGFPHETGGPCWECRLRDEPKNEEAEK